MLRARAYRARVSRASDAERSLVAEPGPPPDLPKARIAMGIEYEGTAFHGWQTQEPGVRAVELCPGAGDSPGSRTIPIRVHCAGADRRRGSMPWNR